MVRLLNNRQSYGMIAILLHWLIAAALITLFVSGLWMTTLDYYHFWYHRAPALHISVGAVVTLLVLLRMLWSLFSETPRQMTGRVVTRMARAVHFLLHLLPLLVAVSGYLMVTADGQGVALFSLFELPPLLEAASERADGAGKYHLWIAWSLMFLSLGHAAAAFFHHFVLHDATLARISGCSSSTRGERV